MEVLIALAIASLAILTMVGVFAGGLQLLTAGKELAVSTGVGRELMEQMKLLPFAEIAEGTFDGGLPTPPVANFPPSPYPTREVSGMRYTYRVIVSVVRPNLKSITTEVLWRNSKKTILQTYVVNGG
ncbi:hypothetical protein DYH09_02620 [bacterium CPR1]|nr:hypothetical protein [bacterium CPR1]